MLRTLARAYNPSGFSATAVPVYTAYPRINDLHCIELNVLLDPERKFTPLKCFMPETLRSLPLWLMKQCATRSFWLNHSDLRGTEMVLIPEEWKVCRWLIKPIQD